MPMYHCSIKIISRSGGRSAVGSAAYRSGEKLYDEETGLLHDFTRKGGVIMSEILLPKNAPQEYLDRQTLWAEVQKVEKRSDAQLAREVEVALPIEMTREQQIECARNYIKENFVDNGMIADWALHDKGDGNPHAHIMLTVRGFDEAHNWEKKTQSVYANGRDEQGRPIYDPSKPSYDPKELKDETGHRPSEQYRIPKLNENGIQKVRVREGKGEEKLWERINIPANNWNDREMAEKWRAAWATECNKYLDPEHQIDHRSFERQGIDDRLPTIHEGVTARKIEAAGGISDRCQINREIQKENSIMLGLKEEVIRLLKELTTQIKETFNELWERIDRLQERFEGRSTNAERSERSGGYDRETPGRSGSFEERKPATADGKRGTEERTHSENFTAAHGVEELREEIGITGKETNERIRKLMERRRAAGSVRESADGKRTDVARKAEAGIRRARTIERDSKTSNADKVSKRQNRDAERERRAAADRKRAEEERRRAEQKRSHSHRESRYDGPSL